MKSIRLINLLWLLLFSTGSHAQTYYQSWKKADGTIVNYTESAKGTGTFDQLINGPLPSDAVPARYGSRSLYAYTLEPDAVVNYAQFGSGLYYDPNFHFCMDWGGDISVDQRRAWGINTFNVSSIKADYSAQGSGKVDWTSQLRAGEGMWYFTQNNLGIYQDATRFFIDPLQDFVSYVYPLIPSLGYDQYANFSRLIFNLETAVFGVDPGQSGGDQIPGWGNGYFNCWNCVKDLPFKLESSNETITLAQLAARGRPSWEVEMFTRRANRMALLPQMVMKKANPAVNPKVSIGYAPWITYQPGMNGLGTSDSFFPGTANVSNIGGDAQGNITLTLPPATPWTTNVQVDGLKYSDFLQGYHYELYPDINNADHQAIFVDKTAPQNYPYLWSKMLPAHIVANEKGWIQLNRSIVANRTGRIRPPVMRQTEPVFEFFNDRVPFPPLQNIVRYGNSNYRDTPRVMVPPYIQYASYAVTRFMAGSEPDWGYYMFPVDLPDVVTPSTQGDPVEGRKYYGHALHSISAIYQARRDMQPYETYYPGSTLIEDPEVKVGESGNWQLYNGTEAVNYNQGVHGTERPGYMLRYKAVGNGTRVLIMGGMRQGWTDERIDQVRIPGGGLSGNTFRVKLRGPGVHLYEFLVPTGATNQVFDAVPAAATNREKPAYTGWINQTN